VRLLNNPIVILFLSFFVGIIADPMLRRLTTYDWLSTRYLFASSKTYEKLGVLLYRKLLLANPFRMLNAKIFLTKNRDLASLKSVREAMATSEVSHWVGFVAMLGLTIFAWWHRGSLVGLAYLFCNIIGNLYPCLLQQYNKRRLDQLISVLEKRDASR
jgi:hypothetical protein